MIRKTGMRKEARVPARRELVRRAEGEQAALESELASTDKPGGKASQSRERARRKRAKGSSRLSQMLTGAMAGIRQQPIARPSVLLAHHLYELNLIFVVEPRKLS